MRLWQNMRERNTTWIWWAGEFEIGLYIGAVLWIVYFRSVVSVRSATDRYVGTREAISFGARF